MSKTDISVFSSSKEKGGEDWCLSMALLDFAECLDDILVVFDKDGNLIYGSSSIKEVLGYEFKEISEFGWWSKVFKNSEVGDIARTSFVSSLALGSKFKERNVAYQRKMISNNGDIKWISWRFVVDKQKNVICFGRDITHQKELEYSLRNYKKRLSTKYKELDNFVYKASHDLKGPVASIMGITNIAKENVQDKSVKQYFNLIAKSSSRLNSILIDLMKISQISQEELQIGPIDLDDLLIQIIDGVRKSTLEEEFKITYDLDCKHVLYSDINMVTAILYNIIENGVKFRKHISNPFVDVQVKSEGEGIRITVIDNGIGIPEKAKHRVFEMFFRGHEHTDGTGLGLHIVKTAVEKLCGHINIIETSKKGTTVSIFLPNLVK